MLSFFKRKSKQNEATPTLNRGVLFEDTGNFLEWGKSTEDLAKIFAAKKIYRADRIIYEWGEHKILKGLELNLVTTHWTNDLNNRGDQFSKIEFNVEGKEDSKQYFESIILSHLKKHYGEGNIKGELPDVSYEWKQGYVKLHLYLFNNKLNFSVSII